MQLRINFLDVGSGSGKKDDTVSSSVEYAIHPLTDITFISLLRIRTPSLSGHCRIGVWMPTELRRW